MDLHAAMGQFFDETGNISLKPELTLAGLCEALYQAEAAQGTDGRTTLRFWDYTQSREGEVRDFTRKEINTRIKAVAARLQQVGTIGDRAVILCNNSPEYLFSFLGTLYAGMVPIPLYDPTEPGHADHLKAVIGDSSPKVVLTNGHSAPAVRSFFASVPGRERPRILAVDSLPDSLAASFVNPLETEAGQALVASGTAPVELTAFLQYTSGSTRTPAGVVLTNRSIITNVLQIFSAAQLQTPLRLASWLPLHHDMGIILGAFIVILGLDLELMAPRDFIQQPKRWIDQLNRRDGDENVYTVVPNFALELAARYGKPADGEQLDFSAVEGLVIGSEPVTEKAVDAFFEVFGPFGLRRNVMRPSYGLAEASLLVTTPQTENRPLFGQFDREALAQGKAKLVDKGHDAVSIASCGQVVRPQFLAIVDPETKQELPDGHVGELWTNGANTAAGYLDRPDDTNETFRNTLAGRLPENSRAQGAPDDNWMASGDLAVIVDNEVFITGRLKDLIIIAGRNHYPADIEYTVDHASEQVRAGAVAAFAIPGDDVEQLIILAERDEQADPSGDAAAIEAIRAAVVDAHGVTPAEIRMMDPDTIARSSSGKIARRVNKKAYLEG